LNNRGLANYHLGRHAKAIADFTDAISIDRDEARLYAHRGLVHMARNDTAAALADYNIAVKLAEDDPTHADMLPTYRERQAKLAATVGAIRTG
jgi:tetratricopeptide (TPR) repeat protein